MRSTACGCVDHGLHEDPHLALVEEFGQYPTVDLTAETELRDGSGTDGLFDLKSVDPAIAELQMHLTIEGLFGRRGGRNREFTGQIDRAIMVEFGDRSGA